MESIENIKNALLGLPLFFQTAIAIIVLGIVFSVFRRVIRPIIWLVIAALSILVIVVIFDK